MIGCNDGVVHRAGFVPERRFSVRYAARKVIRGSNVTTASQKEIRFSAYGKQP
jgi:hypothetical protein